MSAYFHLPAATSGVAMYTNILRARTHVKVSLIDTSMFRSFHRRKLRLRLIDAMHISVYCLSFTWIGIPRYFTFIIQGIPATSGQVSLVRTWDLSLFILRFHSGWRTSIYWMASVSSALQLVRMSMSSAKARRSPRFLISLSFCDEFSASSK